MEVCLKTIGTSYMVAQLRYLAVGSMALARVAAQDARHCATEKPSLLMSVQYASRKETARNEL
eukprot:5873092-Karenia_brevis.AAC.1